MNIAFRVDASTRIGIGHLVRCLTLAKALRERVVQVRFICREHSGHLLQLLQQQAMQVIVLPPPGDSDNKDNSEDYSNWLGTTQAEDARQTITALDGTPQKE